MLQMTRPTKPSNTFQADSVLGRLVKGHCYCMIGRGQSKQQCGAGGSDYCYMLPSNLSFVFEIARQKLAKLRESSNFCYSAETKVTSNKSYTYLYSSNELMLIIKNATIMLLTTLDIFPLTPPTASHPHRCCCGPLWYNLVVDGPADQVYSTGTSSLTFPPF